MSERKTVFDTPSTLADALKCAEGERWPGVRILDSSAIDNAYPDIEQRLSPLEVERAGIRLSYAMITNPLRLSGRAFGVVSVERLTKQNRSETRGLPMPVCNDLFLFKGAYPGFKTFRYVVGWSPSRRWVAATQEARDFFTTDSDWGLFNFIPGLLLAERYRWKAKLLHANGHLIIHTDPRGALRFFKDREAYPGERRAALLHFVKQHKRNVGEEAEEDVTEVRRHLRGVRTFSWNGWQARIDESDFDREALAKELLRGEG